MITDFVPPFPLDKLPFPFPFCPTFPLSPCLLPFPLHVSLLPETHATRDCAPQSCNLASPTFDWVPLVVFCVSFACLLESLSFPSSKSFPCQLTPFPLSSIPLCFMILWSNSRYIVGTPSSTQAQRTAPRLGTPVWFDWSISVPRHVVPRCVCNRTSTHSQ